MAVYVPISDLITARLLMRPQQWNAQTNIVNSCKMVQMFNISSLSCRQFHNIKGKHLNAHSAM